MRGELQACSPAKAGGELQTNRGAPISSEARNLVFLFMSLPNPVIPSEARDLVFARRTRVFARRDLEFANRALVVPAQQQVQPHSGLQKHRGTLPRVGTRGYESFKPFGLYSLMEETPLRSLRPPRFIKNPQGKRRKRPPIKFNYCEDHNTPPRGEEGIL